MDLDFYVSVFLEREDVGFLFPQLFVVFCFQSSGFKIYLCKGFSYFSY